jgi:hypothetical protein
MKSSLHRPIHFLLSLLNHIRLSPWETPSIVSTAGLESVLYSLGADPTVNTVSIVITPIVTCLFISAGNCLPSRCVAMDVYSGSTVPAFRRRVTICSGCIVSNDCFVWWGKKTWLGLMKYCLRGFLEGAKEIREETNDSQHLPVASLVASGC